jgi:hypothetical protein
MFITQSSLEVKWVKELWVFTQKSFELEWVRVK